jgi:serine/threonine-protein kinase SRPK3
MKALFLTSFAWLTLLHFQSGRLLRIPILKPWSLLEVLSEKYAWPPAEARAFAAFLQPLLALEPEQRAPAAQAQHHPWLRC